MGSETHCWKIDGFLGTYETHANGAIERYAFVLFYDKSRPFLVHEFELDVEEQQRRVNEGIDKEDDLRYIIFVIAEGLILRAEQ